ncbi:TetR/AcrR family transcriptional regulator [uncultured Roseibium sp.]|uniref:TetR/AcrR family transcriptional regulator n=1 Tax=uncultured Roseibium sp. TaxID=1936171 RepID=UPI0026033AF5|nr:TetR/AcrR family transcriptional regulator [uncultured Roseibium sp.]
MARPEIKDDRREQILDAFELCVARYGLEGATLGKTAEFAGLARPLIRHNVGNREDLQEALVERFLTRSRDATEHLLASLPDTNRLETLLDVLFDRKSANPHLVLVFNALSAAAPDDAVLAAQLQQWLTDFVGHLKAEIVRAHPETPTSHLEAAAVGISGIYFNVEALYPIGISDRFVTSSRQAAHLLVSTLEAGND